MMKIGIDAKPLPSVDVIADRFIYDSATGVWRYRKTIGGYRAGSVAGRMAKHGYRELTMAGKRYSEHRLAWKFVYGSDPCAAIDHINGNRTDNRIANLRLATRSQNAVNSRAPSKAKSGLRGVYKMYNKYGSYVCFNYKKLWLGLFDTPEEAHAAYCMKRRELFGDYAA